MGEAVGPPRRNVTSFFGTVLFTVPPLAKVSRTQERVDKYAAAQHYEWPGTNNVHPLRAGRGGEMRGGEAGGVGVSGVSEW